MQPLARGNIMYSLTLMAMLLLPGGTSEMNAPCSRPADAPVETVLIREGDLEVLFRDNSRSPGVLSGIDTLINVKDAPGFDAFDPDEQGASAGLNFEHIITGHENPQNAFTPRHGPYALHRLDDGRSVELRRDPRHSPWAMESSFTYRVTPPHYIDFEFACRAHDAKRFGRRGYAILFFANYMNDVTDPSLHFLGVAEPGGEEKWIRDDASTPHQDWNTGGTFRHLDARPLALDDDVSFRLNTWSYEWPRFTKPFYYGRAAHDMTYILMFDRAGSDRDEIRFSLFKFKLKHHPRPAWDFQYVIHNVEENREYGFKGRAVWKRFVGPDDCLREYEQWARSVEVPAVTQPTESGDQATPDGLQR